MMVLDVNVLIYAHHEAAEHYDVYRSWLDDAVNGDEPIGLPLVTSLGFVRIMTNGKVVDPPLTTDQAVDVIRVVRGAEPVEDIHPSDGHWERIRAAARDAQMSGPALTDVHLAVLTMECGGTLVTHDRGFRRFTGLRLFDPLAR